MDQDKQEIATRTRLLEAAALEFSQNGFRSARIREICKEAKANIAAVNYHFRDKKGLYEAVLQYAFEKLPEIEVLDSSDGEKQNPEARLKLFVKSFLGQLMSSGRDVVYVRLISKELTEPTSALDQVIEQGMVPKVKELIAIVAEILKLRTNSKIVKRCAGSIFGQCMYFHFARPVILAAGLESDLGPKAIGELAEHVTKFSLNAMKNLR